MSDGDTIGFRLDETNRLLQGIHDSIPGFLECLMRIADSAERASPPKPTDVLPVGLTDDTDAEPAAHRAAYTVAMAAATSAYDVTLQSGSSYEQARSASSEAFDAAYATAYAKALLDSIKAEGDQ